MAANWTKGLRCGLALALLVALTLAGLGRALATPAEGPAPFEPIRGVRAPICRSVAGEAPAGPARSGGHGCCDDCALLAPAVLPSPPALAEPVPAIRPPGRAGAVSRSTFIARPRDPRLSRGPPAA